jgi:hypothetical protein
LKSQRRCAVARMARIGVRLRSLQRSPQPGFRSTTPFTRTEANGCERCSESTSWGSLVRAQYRPSQKVLETGPFCLPEGDHGVACGHSLATPSPLRDSSEDRSTSPASKSVRSPDETYRDSLATSSGMANMRESQSGGKPSPLARRSIALCKAFRTASSKLSAKPSTLSWLPSRPTR